MAEEDDIDTDSMTMEQITELKGKMEAGESVTSEAKPEEIPAPGSEDDTATSDEADLAAAETTASDAEPDHGSKTVPHKTFHYANERRKAAEKERDEARDRMARLEERTRLLLDEQQQQSKPEAKVEEEIPDPDGDPMKVIKWARDEILARKKADADQAATSERQTQEQRVWNETSERVNTAYTQASAADPAIVEAHNAYRQSIGEELLAMGYTKPQALEEINRVENQHLIHIDQNRLEVGEYIKTLAKARGWRPASPPPAEVPPAAANDKLDKARQAGASLGSSGGAVANTGAITPQMLADMPEDEFRAYMEKNGSTRKAFAI